MATYEDKTHGRALANAGNGNLSNGKGAEVRILSL
jgi:hypothetical protein